MVSELIPVRKYRNAIPPEYRRNMHTRVYWLWHQRFGTIQKVYSTSRDLYDRTACTLFMFAIVSGKLWAIKQIFQYLEGGAMTDQMLEERKSSESV